MARAEIEWRRLDEPAMERATSFSNNGVRVLAGVVDGTTKDHRFYNVRYTVRCAPDWTTREAVLAGHVGQSPVNIVLTRDAATGAWTRNGAPQPQVEQCVDLDLGFSPITNTLPI